MNEPIVWIFIALALLGLTLGAQQIWRRKRRWMTEAGNLGFTYFDENGKKGSSKGTATPAETEWVKSFSFRSLQGGYHVHVLTGRWEGRQVLVADYEQKKFPKDLRVEVQQSSASSTFTRTVFAIRQPGISLPRFLLCRDRSYADRLDWFEGEEIVRFPEDSAFDKAFTVASSNPEKTRAVLSAGVRDLLLRRASDGFYLETRGQDLAIHSGRNRPPSEIRTELDLLTDIAQQLTDD